MLVLHWPASIILRICVVVAVALARNDVADCTAMSFVFVC